MQINNINNIQSGILQSVSPAEKSLEGEKKITEKNGEHLYGKDEYIPSENDEPIGLYSVSQDDEGNPKINYDDPNKAQEDSKKEADDPEKTDEKEKSESCTANTDKVDREIERLKERLQTLEQRAASAEGKERERIEKQIKAAESELMQKDNDSYRRQHTIFS